MSTLIGPLRGRRQCFRSARITPIPSRVSRYRPSIIVSISSKRSIATRPDATQPPKPRSYLRPSIIAAGLVTCLLFYHRTTSANAEAPPTSTSNSTSSTKRFIRLSDVKSHGKDSDSKWVVKGTKVYDITDWISAHPGGEVILRAAGGAIDKYWDMFSIHKKQDVYDILDGYYIGDLDAQDLVNGQVPSDDIDDPFASDPARDAHLLVHSERPCNAETPPEVLNSFITPNDTFYVRNHLWVPDCDSTNCSTNKKCKKKDDHTLHIELHDGTETTYTVADLKRLFPSVTITATLQCSGNRRAHMSSTTGRATIGLPWTVGAISTATFTGVRLRDVLAHAGFPVDNYPADGTVQHAQFVGAEAYGASIPIEKAVDKRGDVLLAYEMGGEPLPRDHGAPLRVVVPGHVAARSVKWLKGIVLSSEESASQWQRRDYKCFGPNVCGAGRDGVDWEAAPAIQEMPVQSAVTDVKEVELGSEEGAVVEVQGYAFSGGGRKIVRVDVSADEGRTWHQAELLRDEATGSKTWAWTRWRWVVPRSVAEAGGQFVVKAVDEVYNTQPEHYEPQWNFRGNLTNAWHRVECPTKKREREARNPA